MNQALKLIESYGILPILNIEREEDAALIAQAIQRGGLPLLEIMFRTEAASACIRQISQQMPEFCVGAGTVLTVEQAEKAKESGAKFIVSPDFNEEVVRYCQKEQIPVVPGCVTPSEVRRALSLGINVLKFFPAIQMGGLKTMQLLSGPYPQVKFVATGDLTRKEMNEYLSFPKVAAVGGDFMLSYDDIKNRRFDKIEQSVRETILEYLDFHIAHVGINCCSSKEAKEVGDMIAATLFQKVTEYDKSYFSGDLFELMKSPFYGKNGHIAVGTRDAERAYTFLKASGVQFCEETMNRDENSRVKAIYLNADFGGFALHLLQHER
ncbi:MAG: Bifunctional 4-hydroxy-2-oxoglutarate aldolase/2-dehydro-3-deoxy-phosphogluconate aldolase [Clostridium sp.]|jgi:2-dehydro-3-deoxyphosphogluconate aldolase / (4S)-4-hydroxy-2-oxoglutarate aldolase